MPADALAPLAAAAPCSTSRRAVPRPDPLDGLNPEQRAAAGFGEPGPDGRFDSPPLLIVAGAGTGKTATLAHRVAHLVMQGVDPMRILLLTFSRRAAQEMTRRAERLVAAARPGPVRLPWAGTFHAIGARLLREYADRVGLEASFGILDRGDAADLVDVVRHELGLSSTRQRFPRKDTCLAIYSQRVNSGRPLERVLNDVFPWCAEWRDELSALFRGYVERKQANGVLDYDDLLLWWHAAMSDPTLAAEVGARFDHVLVDEYQDTNALQAQILLAMKPGGRGLAVVGDDAQSIYAFRAADVGNILDFPAKFEPPAQRITLELNYRSVQPVLDAANALIAQAARQHPKTLRAQRGGGARPQLVTVVDERAQADWVVDAVLRHREAAVPLKRQAVLFRSSHHSATLEIELARRNVPFVKHGGLKFLEAAHIKDLLSVLRWAENPRNAIAGFRALQLMSGVGPATAQRCLDAIGGAPARLLEALRGFAAPAAARDEWDGFVAVMAGLLDPSARWPAQLEPVRRWYQPLLERRHDDAAVRAADLDMLQSIAAQFGTRERFLTELTLDPPQASGDLAGDPLRDEDYLILSTVHSAKGQEWDAVFVINVNDGNFPNEYATGRAESIDEERRLLYVAVTRARDSLYLLEPQRYHVTQQPRFGDAYVHGARSRFLTDALLERFDRVGPAPEAPPAGPGAASAAPKVDVAARIRQMW
ncbi:MAG: ATP-dependent helicase [Steroidobacteraceae bacterium]|nr:ATP-dependent helicase [Steroidobacteraceae bacterium]